MSESKDVNSPDFWQHIYDTERLPWDMGTATPVFQRLIENGAFPHGKVLVVGAGSGHDARLFARHGFDVTAVDFAPGAIATMRAAAEPTAPVDIRQADLFELPEEFSAAFDYVLEYTCFCAIDPEKRPSYAAAIDQTLRPGGQIIALVLPIRGGPGGPPFQASPDEYIALFTERDYSLVLREMPADSIGPRLGNEELVILRKSGG